MTGNKYLIVGINAKYIHSNLAIYSLGAYLSENTNISPCIKEYTINMPVSEILRDIYEEKPDIVAFSTYIWNVEIIISVIKDLKKILPKVAIYMGGPEVSYESKAILVDNPEIDGLMLGEGEQTFSELVLAIEGRGNSLEDIDGLCFRDDISGRIITTKERAPIDLSQIPFPYKNIKDFENRIIYYETSRGCPFGCSYCLSSVDRRLRFRDMKLVKEELLFFLKNNVPQVKLVDRTFNIDHKRSLEMLSYIKEHDNGITNFHFEIAGDILTEDEIEMINSLRPGLIQLEIGVQSTNGCTLDAINRHTDIEKLKKNVSLLLSGGSVHLHLDLIAGLPYENLESFRNSFNDVYAMGSHELQLGFLKVLKGAPIKALSIEQEINHSNAAPYEVLSTKYMSYDDICELKRVEEMLEIYHNSCQFCMTEEYLLSLFETAYDMYLELARYYQEKRQPVIQSKRVVRYEIILEYVASKFDVCEEEIDKLKNLLTLDYYSREKAKARPSFAQDLSDRKMEIRRIRDKYQEKNPGANIHVEPLYDCDEYVLFDYSDRSVITGNVIVQKAR